MFRTVILMMFLATTLSCTSEKSDEKATTAADDQTAKQSQESADDQAADSSASRQAAMANPASVKCEEDGYTLENRTLKAFFLVEVEEESADEPMLGATLEAEPVLGSTLEEEPVLGATLEDEPVLTTLSEEEPVLGQDAATSGGSYAVCKFKDGTECDEWAYYRGECKPGDCEVWEECSLNPLVGGGTQLANPAAEKCKADGLNSEARTNEAGAYSVCIFDDGSECDEWAYFRGECKKGDCEVWETCGK